jgi:hypothetical protein
MTFERPNRRHTGPLQPLRRVAGASGRRRAISFMIAASAVDLSFSCGRPFCHRQSACRWRWRCCGTLATRHRLEAASHHAHAGSHHSTSAPASLFANHVAPFKGEVLRPALAATTDLNRETPATTVTARTLDFVCLPRSRDGHLIYDPRRHRLRRARMCRGTAALLLCAGGCHPRPPLFARGGSRARNAAAVPLARVASATPFRHQLAARGRWRRRNLLSADVSGGSRSATAFTIIFRPST